MAWLDRRSENLDIATLGNLKVRDDPEAIFQEGWLHCDRGLYEAGLNEIQTAVGKGYFVAPTLARSRQFDALREQSRLPERPRRRRSRVRPCARRVPRGGRRTTARHVMKTLAQRHDRDEVLARLANVRPDSPRQWGQMSAPQMICHLSDAFRMAGDKPLPDDSTLAQRTLIKWMALYAPLPWPAGKLVTRPEIDQVQGGGCSPGVFADDVARLVTLVDQFTARDRNVQLARASLLRRDVLQRLAALGLPAHGPPPAPVRGIACVGRRSAVYVATERRVRRTEALARYGTVYVGPSFSSVGSRHESDPPAVHRALRRSVLGAAVATGLGQRSRRRG